MVELTAVVAVTIDVVAESATRVDENADGKLTYELIHI